MISITEKTADAICKEFRGYLTSLEEDEREESATFKKLLELKPEFKDDDIELQMLHSMACAKHDKFVNRVKEEKTKYIHFIEVLMVGETQ